MTTRTRRIVILILAVVLVSGLLLGCEDWNGDQDARLQWQREVGSRQRGLERPTPTIVVERTK